MGLLLIVLVFYLIYVVLYIGCLTFYVDKIFVATVVKYVRSVSGIFEFCLIFRGVVLSVGALYGVSGLCLIFWGFV